MLGLTWNGRDLDRRFLVGLERPVCDSIATALQARLHRRGDRVRRRATAADLFPLDSARLASALKQRRDQLPEAARRYYRHLAGRGRGPRHRPRRDRRRRAGGRPLSPRSRIALRGPGGAWPSRTYRRRFDHEETKEVRLCCTAATTGWWCGAGRRRRADPGAPGKGTDAVGGLLARAGGRALHRPSRTTACCPGRDVAVSRSPMRRRDTALRDWGTAGSRHSGSPAGPTSGSSRDRRLLHPVWVPPGSLRLRGTGCGRDVHRAPTGRADFTADWRRPNSRVRDGLFARASGIEVLRFHGFGNETSGDEDGRVLPGGPGRPHARALRRACPVGHRAELTARSAAPLLGHRLRRRRGSSRRRGPTARARSACSGARGPSRSTAATAPRRPPTALLLASAGAFYPAVLDVEDTFGELHAVGAAYLTADSLPLQPTLALRPAASRCGATFPFQESAFIGDASTVRLGRQNRYAGEASLYAGSELRLFLTTFYFFAPAISGCSVWRTWGGCFSTARNRTSGTPPAAADLALVPRAGEHAQPRGGEELRADGALLGDRVAGSDADRR